MVNENDFADRLASVGFTVQVLKNVDLLDKDELDRFGISEEGLSFLCLKQTLIES